MRIRTAVHPAPNPVVIQRVCIRDELDRHRTRKRQRHSHVISSDVLEENGWNVDQRGAVFDKKTGRRVFKNGFFTALKKVLAKHSDESKFREVL